MKNESRPIKNMGSVSMKWLNSIGICTLRDLAEIGSIEAYKRIKDLHPGANIVMLYAMEAALWDLHWAHLPPELKQSLQEQIGYQPKGGGRGRKKGHL